MINNTPVSLGTIVSYHVKANEDGLYNVMHFNTAKCGENHTHQYFLTQSSFQDQMSQLNEYLVFCSYLQDDLKRNAVAQLSGSREL